MTDPEIIADYEDWLHWIANEIGRDWNHDDLVQEGRIAMWRALETFDATKGSLPSWLTGAAEPRMRSLAYGKGQPFGHEPVRGHQEAQGAVSLDALDSDQVDGLLGYVEAAYHDGSILDAVRRLPPAQREYVFLRFWGGLDPTSRAPATRELVSQFPSLGRRHLWQRATENLRESLVHEGAAQSQQ